MQLSNLPKGQKAYGGSLLNTRRGRESGRPISTRHSMHLVLKSSKARGAWSFRKHKFQIKKLVDKFSARYGVRVFSIANVGNHIHMHIKLSNRHTYKAFIRGLSSSMATAVTGFSRWHKPPVGWKGFWDYRPFTRILVSFTEFLRLRDYLYINRLEGYGYKRTQAEFIVRQSRNQKYGFA